jgi:translation initiation factor IF-3
MTMVLAPHRGAKTRARAAEQASGPPAAPPPAAEPEITTDQT